MAIQIIGNVGNQGYALPMVSAFPLNVNNQYLLGWNPAQQALDYVPFIVDVLGSVQILKDLSVAEDLTVGATMAVTGAATLGSTLSVTGAITSGSSITSGAGATAAALTPGATPQLSMSGTKVVETRKTGWGVPTGISDRTTFDTATVTLPQLAQRFKALKEDLTTHGLIGA